jgi:hypothetical protein
MIRLSKSVLAVGGVVLAGGLITLMNPRTVHAVVAAALVQVTNTTSNPVVAQGIDKQAGNIVHLSCSQVTLLDEISSCAQILANGNRSDGNYTVPVGESLVITSLDVTPISVANCPGNYIIVLEPQTSGASFVVVTANAQVTTHFAYPSGLVIGEGISPRLAGNSRSSGGINVACAGALIVDIFGYLTAA